MAAAREQLGRIEGAIAAVALSPLILQRAALPMATVVKTLDSTHLASAMLLRERRGFELSFATHDPQRARAARALGFPCLGV